MAICGNAPCFSISDIQMTYKQLLPLLHVKRPLGVLGWKSNNGKWHTVGRLMSPNLELEQGTNVSDNLG